MNPQASSHHETGLANASRRPYFPFYAREELTSKLRLLPDGGRLLAIDLRSWSWAHEGIENSEEVLLALARSLGFSRYKFKKFWPIVKMFFTERDGFLFWSDDERYREKVVNIQSKRKMAGHLGGLAKNKKDEQEPSEQQELPLANATLLLDRLPDKPTTKPSSYSTSTPPPPEEGRPVVEAEDPAGGGGEVEKIISNGNGMKTLEAEHRAISEHCHRIGIPAPSPVLSSQLRAKFPGIPISEVLQNLPRFDGQTSPGLWRDLGPESLKAEAQRQKNPVQPKKKMTSADVLRAEIAQRAGGGG
jgi:hypothetical protein